ncbi:MAG TPA: carbon storage regulator CsrA [Candidatus Limnocylindria bacterium]|jgi:carbon storage regulator|nr:carbon storage regulator CsrA [Candidatus Limnocylindria bacterium]
MLVLTRKPGESIIIDGRIIVKVVRLDGDAVRIGIEAPADVLIHRQEIYEEIQQSNQEALTKTRPNVPRLSAPLRPASAGPAVPSASAPLQP